MQKSKAKARFEVKMSLLCKESLHAALPCHQVTIFRHRGVELRRESAGDFTFFVRTWSGERCRMEKKKHAFTETISAEVGA